MADTILILRASAETQTTPRVPFSFRRPRIGFAKNLTELKGHLLRCLERMEGKASVLPASILIDAGPNNTDIKSELSRWLEQHLKLRGIRVVLPNELSWMARCWRAFGRWLRWW